MKHYVLIEFETDKPIADLTDKIAGRVYTMEGIRNGGDVAATILTGEIEGFMQKLSGRFVASQKGVQ